MYNIKDISEFFFEIEEKYDLFNYQINGIFVWKLIRFKLVNIIAGNAKLYGETFKNEYDNKSKFDKLKYLFKYSYYYIFRNAKNSNKKRDIIIFQYKRKKLIQNKYIDIYTNKLINDLKANKENFEVIDIPDLWIKPRVNFGVKFALPSLIDKFIYRRIKKINILNDDITFLSKINNEINIKFSIQLNLISLVVLYIKIFCSNKKYFDKLFIKKSPQKIFMINSYGQEPMIAAAQQLAIEVRELQHGVMTKYHMGYSFPNAGSIPYFPDKLYLYGKFWHDTTPLPLSNENIVFYGFPYLTSDIEKFKNTKRIKNQILFISQPTINDKLADFAYEFALKNKGYKIIYKLHPSQKINLNDKNYILNTANKLDNFEMIIGSDKNLYELMYSSEIQVGAYSTALFEGLYTGLKTIIADLPGIEHMEALLDKGYAVLCKNPDDLINKINTFKFHKIDGQYYYKS